jgi:hypothetical protein
MDFSGSGQYLTIASPSSILDFPTGASFSLTGWFNRDLFVNDHTILSNVAAQGDDGYIVWIDGDDSLYFRADDNADANYRQLVSATKFAATGWHHFAVSWEDDRDADLYIDGALDASTKTGTFASVDDLTNANAFRLGAETDAGNPFDGKLDDIRVYGYPLSAGDVSKLYQTTAPAQPVDTGLVGHWTFDGADIQGTTVIDRSGKGNNGTATGTTKTIGKLGQGLSFNGTSDHVSLSDFFSGMDDGTISLWVKTTNDAAMTLFGVNRGGVPCSDNHWNLLIGDGSDGYDDNGLITIVYNYGTTYILYYSTLNRSELFDGNWHNITVTNDSAHHIYLDGVSKTITDHFGNDGGELFDIYSLNSFRIGSQYCNSAEQNFFNGKMDDVHIYNRALTATEVANLYHTGK